MQELQYLQELYETIQDCLINNDLERLKEFNQNDVDYVKSKLNI